MKNYRLINLITGWTVFLISAVVYILTIEPTTSFWDCGEFISAAYKLEVGHPPGAPFFMLLGRFFTLFAPSPDKVAASVNILSALASAFTILFLFWTITHLTKKVFSPNNENPDLHAGIAILGAGIVGALAYTFSDTFWFSAVEGEVYASSSLFTAIVFWAVLKWENIAGQKYANRWLLLIAYLMGLSIGVHLLNLLAIPAVVLVIYFKTRKATAKGIVYAMLISGVIIASVMWGIIPGIVKVASKFELFFVNTIGLGFNAGVYIYILLLCLTLIAGIYFTQQNKYNHTLATILFTLGFVLLGIPTMGGGILMGLLITAAAFLIVYFFFKNKKSVLNTILTALTLVALGYSTYSVILIRSSADPPMDQNNPENPFTLLSYLNREQYGSSPLLHGQYFNAPVEEMEDGAPIYRPVKNNYKVVSHKPDYKYDERFMTLFPRMYSNQQKHIDAYKRWVQINGRKIKVTGQQGEQQTREKPSFADNLSFFFNYQVGYMYLRYFMWNFTGRQNDIQGHFKEEITKGNWISGITFIDEWRLGPQDKLPDHLKKNKARNTYYFLPLILGLIGMIFHYKHKKLDFWVVLLLFILTGLAIVVYLNQPPLQPRERDYAYAGSFYAFAIWIGLGVAGIFKLLNRNMNKTLPALLACLLSLPVPVILAVENWDDHDRSGRYTARDFAYNYLNSCDPNAILFTNGDNDTFPLWYAQEVEGIRTDVRVVNLSYLGADWYINQLEHHYYDSPEIPLTLTQEKYRQGSRDIAYIVDRVNRPVPVLEAMKFLASDQPKTKQIPNYQGEVDHIPAKTLIIPADSAAIARSGYVPEELMKYFSDVSITLDNRYLVKNHIMVLDILANNNWNRPVYYAITVSSDNYLNLGSHFIVEGLTYKVAPVNVPSDQMGQHGKVDTRKMFDNLVNKFKWGGIENDIYLNENNRRMLTNFRNSFSRLALNLIEEGKNDSARVALDKAIELMPNEKVKFGIFTLPVIEGYYKLGDFEKGNRVAKQLSGVVIDDLEYYMSVPGKYSKGIEYEMRLNTYLSQQLTSLAGRYGQNDILTELESFMQEKQLNPFPGMQ